MTAVLTLLIVWLVAAPLCALAVGKTLAAMDRRADLPGTHRVPRAEMPGTATTVTRAGTRGRREANYGTRASRPSP